MPTESTTEPTRHFTGFFVPAIVSAEPIRIYVEATQNEGSGLNWLTLADVLTAAGTIAMAVTTAIVVRQNRRQHQDASMPICILVPDGGLDAQGRREVVQHNNDPHNSVPFYRVHCGVKNIGTGPAVKLKLIMQFLPNLAAQPQVELQPLGPDQRISSPIRVPVVLNGRFNQADYEFASHGQWRLWLEYEDVFGNEFPTRHVKNPQERWASFGKGPIEKVSCNAQ